MRPGVELLGHADEEEKDGRKGIPRTGHPRGKGKEEKGRESDRSENLVQIVGKLSFRDCPRSLMMALECSNLLANDRGFPYAGEGFE